MEGYLLFDLNNEPNQYGCEKFNRYTELNPLVGDSPFIIVKKGLCNPTQKVKNIEEAGGHAAIIINDKDEPIEKMFKNCFHKIAILTILFNSITSDLIIRSPKELQSQFISKTN